MSTRKYQSALPSFTGSLAAEELDTAAEEELGITEETSELETAACDEELATGELLVLATRELTEEELGVGAVPVRTRIPLNVPLSVVVDTAILKLPS